MGPDNQKSYQVQDGKLAWDDRGGSAAFANLARTLI